ncbi:MAG: UDP-glucose/iron transport system ATP-binding protein [Methanolobus sp.]|jgi:putative ABC transport system ATP-binding protein|uniref:Putative ABC transport system ATP-binding protein n=1 Tax=Methanolobus vulcani TaxID=38026 RepID=A0A7Z7FCR5_9EURY|nr:ATP-binding cassette domain-containing protein [Methanolobus vulcani]MDI3486164.1 UDP-glucose/iron transport system ATP-binding protein [Methanolobus sp.]MDK2825069.1 UDP-glucose/iron transport system ATP-binding protein [Methanolobus sp.]MDK2939025.1 UDP-glucose/iron transport system ATP-binding protein [Methanolobus sp.]SDF87946.1 putative ABC transport system ATP-binding protein [Methanolobus vulcani]
MGLLDIQNLSVSYDGKSILSDFNFSILKGEKILIKGNSGIGKSTLFRMIMGFGKYNSGEIYLEGVPVDADNIWDIRKKVAYVSQDTDIAEGKVSDLIDEVFSFKANRNNNGKSDLEKLLNRLSLSPDLVNKEYMKLSGGEKQRVVLVLALLSGKDIFLLDEVTSELDTGLKQKVVDIFFDNPQWTVLAISHDREWETKAMKVIDFSGRVN